MASSVSNLKSPPIHLHRRNPFSLLLPLSTLSFPSSSHRFPSRALKTQSAAGGIRSGVGDGYSASSSSSADVLRKPVVVPEEDPSGDSEDEDEAENEEVRVEDKILEDTVPLVGFARMVLHSGKYESGERLSPQHEKVILERFLPYHPECEMKIGCGVDYITIGYHPDFPYSRCLFIVRKDGEVIDFSFWKCIKGLVRKKYPHHANSFILRHFRWRRHIDWR
ncbi:hypothetical protein RHGRI_016259 [Rhododendron griersonianum]|uniref:DCL protein n=1 Tax=Rhododendron griersonianum TaxID=479676 RepID=A0AAV6JTI9_9ERIC|nr:hypothetical protein RHGRI_016259 [Rhododendron griersonianum]